MRFFNKINYIVNLFTYLSKINDRRTQGPLILSEIHENTKLAQYDKVPRKEEKQTNKQTNDIKQTKHITNQHTVQSANRKIFLLLKGEVKLYQTPFKRCYGWGRNYIIR